MELEQAIQELRREAAHWSGYDEETRHLLRQQAAERASIVRKDHSSEVYPSTMG